MSANRSASRSSRGGSASRLTRNPSAGGDTAGEQAAQQVRIIGGQWRRTPLPVPVSSGLRPTPSRVRETLFNWLGQDLAGWRVLDAFAGSGALGLEAASRGADHVVMLEKVPALARSIQAVCDRLKATQVRVQQGDALAWMGQPRQHAQFDLVFLDPPFEADLFEAALQRAIPCVPLGGWVYLESPHAYHGELGVPCPAGLNLYRHGQAGAVHFHLFQRVAVAAESAQATV